MDILIIAQEAWIPACAGMTDGMPISRQQILNSSA